MPHMHIGLGAIAVTAVAIVGVVWLCKRDWKKKTVRVLNNDGGYVTTQPTYTFPNKPVYPNYTPRGCGAILPPGPTYYQPTQTVVSGPLNNNGSSLVEGMVLGAVLDEVLTDHHGNNVESHNDYRSDYSQPSTDNGSWDTGSSTSQDNDVSYDSGSSNSSDSSSGIDVSW